MSAANKLISERLKVLDHLQSVSELERAQLQDAKAALEARPDPGPIELVRHLVRHLDPEDALRWHLCGALELTDQMRRTGLRPQGRQRLVDHLEKITRILGRELPIARVSGDAATDREFHDQARRMAAAFRSLKIEVLLPNPDGVRRVMTELVQAFCAAACDDWRHMPGVDSSDTGSTNGKVAGDVAGTSTS